MDYLIFDLARLLRKSGFAVSTREIADCVQALNVLSANKLTKYDVYKLMNATLLKTEWGAAYIQQLAELFLEPDPEILADHAGVLSPTNSSSRETGEGESGCGRAGSGAAMSLLTGAVLNQDLDLLYALIRRHALSLSLLCEDRETALLDFKLQSGWLQVAAIIEEKYRLGEILPADYHSALTSLSQWENFLKEESERLQVRNMSRDYLSQLMKQHNPRYLKFLDVDDADISVISRELAKLARKLAVRKGRRRQEAKQGRIDISRSIRRAMPTGGVLLKLAKMARKQAKPDLCLLCDMSNSVRKFSYFMLLFVYTLQTRYSHIRSFLFVDQLLETADYFKERDVDSALGNIGSLKGFNLSGFSHYGNVIHQFTAHYLNVIHRNTTVLILGDAKNNWNTVDGSEVLPKISEQAKALYWLNPVEQELWNRNDCIMEKYRPSCTGVYPCANLEQLERFVIEAL
ncbi:VWA domain-containing protein [Sporomusa aerivorans]|uniref:VWA domain-containing protein n=1 Tax=Sporomusa aerivorans TaxID=204936 RepID=UPI00352A6103